MRKRIFILTIVLMFMFVTSVKAELIDETKVIDLSDYSFTDTTSAEEIIIDLGGTYDLSEKGFYLYLSNEVSNVVVKVDGIINSGDGFYSLGSNITGVGEHYISGISSVNGETADSVSKIMIQNRSVTSGVYSTYSLDGCYIKFYTGNKIDNGEDVIEFKLLEMNSDIDNETFTFTFNKPITVEDTNIEFKRTDTNEAISFNKNIVENELKIIPCDDLSIGSYRIRLLTVTSNENDVLNDIYMTFLKQNEFYITEQDFCEYITIDTETLKLKCNKQFTVTTCTINGVATATQIDDLTKQLTITMPSLTEDTEYNLVLKLKSKDNENIDFEYNMTTSSLTGNPSLDKIMMKLLNMLENIKKNGIIVVISAIVVGCIFVGATWIWKQAKKWIKKVK